MGAPQGYLFPGQTKPLDRKRRETIRVLTSDVTLSSRERSMMESWEASMWRDRRETAVEPVVQTGTRWAALVAWWNRLAFRMQLGPVGCSEPIL